MAGALACVAVSTTTLGICIGSVDDKYNAMSESLKAQSSELFEESRSIKELSDVRYRNLQERISLLDKTVNNTNVPEDEDIYIEETDDEVEVLAEDTAVIAEPEPVDTSKERLPEGDTNTFRCMDYRTITDKNSVQYKIQQNCYTDPDTGIRYILHDGIRYYTAALGSAYGKTLGDTFKVTLHNGSSFYVMYAEFKNPIWDLNPCFFGDPDVNYDRHNCTNVIEFIIDGKLTPSRVMSAGTMSALESFGGLYGSGGNIADISYLGAVDWAG